MNPNWRHETAELIQVSHHLGADPLLVQAGGGNTSAKCADGATMLVKASGTTMSRMTGSAGWVAVSREKIRGLLLRGREMASLPPPEREKQVVAALYDSVVPPTEGRPSVETPLHAMLGTVVMHSHPVWVNGLCCHQRGEQLLRELTSGDAAAPLWVPYIDPGATLAFVLDERIGEYSSRFGTTPTAIFLENHGFFCAAPTAAECISLHTGWMERLRSFFGVSLELKATHEWTPATTAEVSKGLARAAAECGVPEPRLRFSERPELAFAAVPTNKVLFDRALSPDHVVYSGPCALQLPHTPTADQVTGAATRYHRTHGMMPKLVIVEGRGMCATGKSPSAVEAAEAMAVAGVQISLLAGKEIKFMSAPQVSFIMNWEAEHYRARVG